VIDTNMSGQSSKALDHVLRIHFLECRQLIWRRSTVGILGWTYLSGVKNHYQSNYNSNSKASDKQGPADTFPEVSFVFFHLKLHGYLFKMSTIASETTRQARIESSNVITSITARHPRSNSLYNFLAFMTVQRLSGPPTTAPPSAGTAPHRQWVVSAYACP
jgi:hypothetical protein